VTALSDVTVAGPFGLAALAGRVPPGCMLTVTGRPVTVTGLLTCTDEHDTWLELLLSGPGGPGWLAVEAPGGRPCCTLWSRRAVPAAGPAAPVPGPGWRTAARGTAEFRSAGTFGSLAIPPAGRLRYVEYERDGARCAAERFASSLPWLLGSGTGVPVAVTAGGPDAGRAHRAAGPTPAGR